MTTRKRNRGWTRKGDIKRYTMLAFIDSYIDEHDYPPTITEIQAATGEKFRGNVVMYLNQLEECGWIRRDPIVARAISITRTGKAKAREYGKKQAEAGV